MIWAASYLKGKTFTRFKPYIAYYLEKESIANCDPIIAKVVDIIGHYLYLFL
jgi:hypothetical protein